MNRNSVPTMHTSYESSSSKVTYHVPEPVLRTEVNCESGDYVVTFPVLDAHTNVGFGMVDQTCYKFVWIRCVYNLIENIALSEVSLYTSNTDAWSNLPTITYSVSALPIRGESLFMYLILPKCFRYCKM
jgi:hypothetical protein